MINCRLGDLVAADDSKAFERLGARPLPPKVAYSVAKFLSLVRKELKIYRELHNKLVQEHGDETPAGSGNYSVPPPKFPAFAALLTELLDSPVTIAWTALTLEELGAEPMRADDLVALEPFLATPTPKP